MKFRNKLIPAISVACLALLIFTYFSMSKCKRHYTLLEYGHSEVVSNCECRSIEDFGFGKFSIPQVCKVVKMQNEALLIECMNFQGRISLKRLNDINILKDQLSIATNIKDNEQSSYFDMLVSLFKRCEYEKSFFGKFFDSSYDADISIVSLLLLPRTETIHAYRLPNFNILLLDHKDSIDVYFYSKDNASTYYWLNIYSPVFAMDIAKLFIHCSACLQ